MAETTENKRKTPERRKIPFVVEVQETVGGSWKSVGIAPNMDVSQVTADTTAEAMRWIKANGQDGKTYRVAHVTFGPVTVKTESVPKRTLQ